jgi:hypothetical protein
MRMTCRARDVFGTERRERRVVCIDGTGGRPGLLEGMRYTRVETVWGWCVCGGGNVAREACPPCLCGIGHFFNGRPGLPPHIPGAPSFFHISLVALPQPRTKKCGGTLCVCFACLALADLSSFPPPTLSQTGSSKLKPGHHQHLVFLLLPPSSCCCNYRHLASPVLPLLLLVLLRLLL